MFLKNKKILGAISFIVLIAMVTLGLNFGKAEAADISRFQGKDRIETANSVALGIFKNTDSVILVNGLRFPDAAAAAPLSNILNAPVLLTSNQGIIEPKVLDTMKSLGAKKVYIVGGVGVVSSSIERSLKSKGYTVTRYDGVKYGEDSRYGTSARVAEEILKLNPSTKDTILVNGLYSYSDALSVASICAMKKMPVLFSDSKHIPKVIKNVIDKHGLKVMAAGSSGILPDSVINSVGGTRITKDSEAKDRFATNLSVLKYFKDKGLNFNNVYIATGGYRGKVGELLFADGLVAAAAAAKTGSPLILNGIAASDSQTAEAEKLIGDNVSKNSKIFIVGADCRVSQKVENSLMEKVGDFQVIDIN